MLVLGIFVASPPNARAGLTPDPTFGTGGTAYFGIEAQPAFVQGARSVAIDGQGRVVVAALVQSLVGVHQFALQPHIARLNADGSLADYSGAATCLAGNTVQYDFEQGDALAVAADGTIVIAGTCTGTLQAVVVRFRPDGAVAGVTYLPTESRIAFQPYSARAQRVAIQPDGMILVAGSQRLLNGPERAAVWRLQPNGALDTAFATGGFHVLDFPSVYFAVEVMPDGRIVAGGRAESSPPGGTTNQDLLLARLLPSGTIDTSFNGGVQSINLGLLTSSTAGNEPTDDQVNSLALRSDGSILLAAQSAQPTGALLLQFTSAGLLDAAFGEQGHVALGSAAEAPMDVALLSDGSAVVVGKRPVTQVSLDGRFTSEIVMTSSYASIARQADDKVVLAIGGIARDMGVTRLVTSEIPDITPDAFDFGNVDNAELQDSIVSQPVAIQGLDTSVDVSVTGGEFALHCNGQWIPPGEVRSIGPNETVCVRHVSAARSATRVETLLSVAGVVGNFVSTTGDADPDPIVIPKQNGVARSAPVYTDITVTGITISAPITLSGGELSIGCGGSYSSATAKVRNGEHVCLRHISRSGPSATQVTIVRIGETRGLFMSSTRAGGAIDWILVTLLVSMIALRAFRGAVLHANPFSSFALAARTDRGHH